MHVTQWKEPALSWNGKVAEDGRAAILEIRSDDFVPQFLQAMAGADPGAYYDRHHLVPRPAGHLLKLYQPLHSRYYLVTASLVCRQVGLPDKAINRANGESVFFVIRRRTGSGEEAWISVDKGGYWLPLQGQAVLRVAAGEERLPLHPVQIQPSPPSPRSVFTDNVPRELHYGYIPAGNRNKYRDTLGRAMTAVPAPQALVNSFFTDAEANGLPIKGFRHEMFNRRVFLPWSSLANNLETIGSPRLKVEISSNAQTEQLYAVLELADFFKTNLPTLWEGLEAAEDSSLPAAMTTLYQRLTDSTADKPFEIKRNGSDAMLGAVLLALKGHINLVRGQGTIPPTDLDMRGFLGLVGGNSQLGDLKKLVDEAIDEEMLPIQIPDGSDNELVHLITEQVQPREPEGREATYHIRVVYAYDPECPPLVSPNTSYPFQLAPYFDPDAPARLVKLEAPSMKPQDLRKYARGVGIEMPPELHNLSNCMQGDKLDAIVDSIGSCNEGLSIRMICTFSIQIIFLVAFIVMFSFLIMLNFVFGWLAYLRICLPIPVKE